MANCKKTRGTNESGVALLIAIFVLLLISVVAIALLISSGTETTLGANYRSSSTVYYGALAGLEEARGRLLPKNPDYFTLAVVPTPFPLGQPVYMMNQLPGETVAPWDSGNPYYDKEYAAEFGTQASAVPYQPVYSTWNNNAKGIPGPAYKWVRITAATEQSLNLDVDSNHHALDATTPIYYDPTQVDSHGNPAPSLVVGSRPSPAVQVLQITALAALPNGSQKLLQYVVAPAGQNNLSFPAALTLDGPNLGGGPPYWLPNSTSFWVKGDDQEFYASAGACAAGANPSAAPVRAVGVIDPGSVTYVKGLISGWHEYTGLGDIPSQPNVFNVSNPPAPAPTNPTLAGNLATVSVSALNSLVSNISQSADLTLNGMVTPVHQNDTHSVMPEGMSAANPMTVVVNGDFDTTGWTGAGYGILVVTGTFTYDVSSSWNGIVLVIGKGVFFSPQSGGGPGQINGAILLATTLDSHYDPLASLGTPNVNFNNGEGAGSVGVYYSSCWIQYVQSPSKYQILSFHEIPQS